MAAVLPKGGGSRVKQMVVFPKDFAIPRSMHWEGRSLSNTYGKMRVQPFEEGFTLTIANALRRILLSFIEGAAITSVRIDGALHEFCSLRGVVEDVADIILNLKALRFRLHGDRPKTLYLKAAGEGEVRAFRISHDPNVEIMKPDLYIATLDEDGSLEIEIEVRKGLGYVPAERNRWEEMPIGTIPVDSLFSPVVKVAYQVEPVKEGDPLHRERLILEVWTDGAIEPPQAVREAVAILVDQLDVFLGVEEAEVVEEEIDEVGQRFYPNLKRNIEELELSVRAANCLRNANIRYVYDLIQRKESDLLKMRNFGRKSLKELQGVLKEMGLSLGVKLPEDFLKRLKEEVERGEDSS